MTVYGLPGEYTITDPEIFYWLQTKLEVSLCIILIYMFERKMWWYVYYIKYKCYFEYRKKQTQKTQQQNIFYTNALLTSLKKTKSNEIQTSEIFILPVGCRRFGNPILSGVDRLWGKSVTILTDTFFGYLYFTSILWKLNFQIFEILFKTNIWCFTQLRYTVYLMSGKIDI
jgi:hypothetical protein